MKGGTVLLKDDKNLQDRPSPSSFREDVKIDVTGQASLPGFVAPWPTASASRPVTGKIADALDPFHESIKLALAGGITTPSWSPAAGAGALRRRRAASGAGRVIKMSYGTLDEDAGAETGGCCRWRT
jgi:hypothetical protein